MIIKFKIYENKNSDLDLETFKGKIARNNNLHVYYYMDYVSKDIDGYYHIFGLTFNFLFNRVFETTVPSRYEFIEDNFNDLLIWTVDEFYEESPELLKKLYVDVKNNPDNRVYGSYKKLLRKLENNEKLMLDVESDKFNL